MATKKDEENIHVAGGISACIASTPGTIEFSFLLSCNDSDSDAV
jgi:hypothetical protein